CAVAVLAVNARTATKAAVAKKDLFMRLSPKSNYC
ncbi:MAG: hypothetical protein ACI97A_003620, partial [Planctomycetota bacterium]